MKKVIYYLMILVCTVCISCSGSGSDAAGTYRFQDERHRTYTLVLNPNKTAVFIDLDETYGEWDAGNGIIAVHFNSSVAYCWWPCGNGSIVQKSTLNLIIHDGYVYSEMEALNAGSEYYRLPIEKVE